MHLGRMAYPPAVSSIQRDLTVNRVHRSSSMRHMYTCRRYTAQMHPRCGRDAAGACAPWSCARRSPCTRSRTCRRPCSRTRASARRCTGDESRHSPRGSAGAARLLEPSGPCRALVGPPPRPLAALAVLVERDAQPHQLVVLELAAGDQGVRAVHHNALRSGTVRRAPLGSGECAQRGIRALAVVIGRESPALTETLQPITCSVFIFSMISCERTQ